MRQNRVEPLIFCFEVTAGGEAMGGQNHAGEVSKFKFRSLSLICAVIHLSSISGRSSTQKKLEIYCRQKKKKRRNKIQGCRGQNHAGEVSKFRFRSLSLI